MTRRCLTGWPEPWICSRPWRLRSALATVVELCEGPRCVHELQTSLEASGRAVSQPLLSQHLKVLREAGLVTTTRRGTEITYQLADAHVGHIVNDAIRHSQEEHP